MYVITERKRNGNHCKYCPKQLEAFIWILILKSFFNQSYIFKSKKGSYGHLLWPMEHQQLHKMSHESWLF